MCKVIKRFRDKETKETYEIGSIYESNSENRVNELQKLGYIEAAKEGKPSILKQNVGNVKAIITNEFSKEQLQELLEQEIAGENRKGVKEHIESVLVEIEEEGK